MLTFYHIQMKIEPEKIKNGKQISKGLLLFKKNSPSYKLAKNISSLYGGFYQTEILIPTNLYTTSFTPTDNRIIKISKNNLKEYEEFRKKYSKDLIKELNKRHIIGFDSTDIMVFKKMDGGGVLWNIPNEIKIGKTEKILVKAKKKA